MDIALHRADHHLAHARCAGFDQKRAQDGHPGFHGVGGHEDFRHEQDAVAKIDADDAHALYQGLCQDAIGCPATPEQDVDALFDFVFQTVIEIVMHLLH